MTDLTANGFGSWLVDSVSHADWLDDQRRLSRAQIGEQGIPTSKQEDWRYTSLKGLLEQCFTPVDETITALAPDDLEDILIPGLDSHRIVLVNGRYAPDLSMPGEIPKGVRFDSLRTLLDTDPDAVRDHLNRPLSALRAGVEDEPQPLFLALNTAGFDDGLVVRLERAAMLERPIELIHLSVGMDEPRVAQPRHLIILGEGAQAILIERYVSLGDSIYCTNAVLDISLGCDAILRHERIQMESANAFHLTGLYLNQDAGSHYQGVNIGLGARWSRTDLVTDFRGEHARCELQGLYLAGDRQFMDYHLDVTHSVPRCTSRENFKGILYGRGRAVFDGNVVVARHAQKSDAAMSNRNLMLSESAEVDTKPQLDIHADDVKCSHGTTVGQLEPEMLFYLRSRGISAALARRMLCLGFAGEIIQTLSSELLREHVSGQVGQRLESAPLD